MKYLSVILAALAVILTAQMLFAKSGGARSEAWTCFGTTANASVTDLTVNVDNIEMTSSGLLHDRRMPKPAVEMSAARSFLYKLSGVAAKDQRQYVVLLVRERIETAGQAIVTVSGLSDRGGDSEPVETLSCEINLEK